MDNNNNNNTLNNKIFKCNLNIIIINNQVMITVIIKINKIILLLQITIIIRIIKRKIKMHKKVVEVETDSIINLLILI